ncbi:PqqD family peptide modification chaperone [Nocardiopsis halophila]|uniref:PqqD family peptide modification chaperone n=1 Tax=Nocardiopsis halophila TaxID=141692 RepID=UPI0003497CAE|nr:PqqD family peptide modification chaperone [Nocardiopsis halophila]
MLRLKPWVTMSTNDEGALLLDSRRGVYWHLDPVGVSVAEALEREPSLDDLVQAVTAEFDVDANVAKRDVRRLLKDLKKARLIEGRIA